MITARFHLQVAYIIIMIRKEGKIKWKIWSIWDLLKIWRNEIMKSISFFFSYSRMNENNI
jgi:hypothetical protein